MTVPFDGVHHVGITVADLERSIGFWTAMLGRPERDRRIMDGPRLGELLGYPAARMDSCWFDLPGGVALELLQYLEPLEQPYEHGNAHPGNVHVCLEVDDMETAHPHAVAAGALPVSPAPITIARGPKAGTKVAYVRDPDGVTIELLQPRRDR